MHLVEWLTLKKKKLTPNADEDAEAQELLLVPGGNFKRYSHFRRQFGSFFVYPQNS